MHIPVWKETFTFILHLELSWWQINGIHCVAHWTNEGVHQMKNECPHYKRWHQFVGYEIWFSGMFTFNRIVQEINQQEARGIMTCLLTFLQALSLFLKQSLSNLLNCLSHYSVQLFISTAAGVGRCSLIACRVLSN